MDKNPTCACCKETEFTCRPVLMPNNNYWCPVICKSCGAIVGQIPSNDEQEALKQIVGISTILERLDNIQTLLYNLEAGITKDLD